MELAAGGAGHPVTGGVGAWWAARGRGQRIAVGAVGLLVAVNVGLSAAGALVGGDPGGPVSSSFSTGGDGLEGYADLLEVGGHEVVRLRERVDADNLRSRDTAVLADPSGLTAADARTIGRFVADGGRLVVAGESSAPLVAALFEAPVEWRSVQSDGLDVWVPAADLGGALELVGDDGGRWAELPAEVLPVAGAGDQPSVVVANVGSGRVVALADAGPLQNDALARADNAAFALGVAGSSDRRVVFVEATRGYGATGLAAVPSAWKWSGAGALVTLAFGLWAAGTRFGPAEPAERALRPPRRAHVDAVAAGLDRSTSDPAAVIAPLRTRSRAELAERLGVDHDASPGVLYAAARQARLDDAQVAVLVAEPASLDDALAIGAVAARQQRSRRRTQRTMASRPDQPASEEPIP